MYIKMIKNLIQQKLQTTTYYLHVVLVCWCDFFFVLLHAANILYASEAYKLASQNVSKSGIMSQQMTFIYI